MPIELRWYWVMLLCVASDQPERGTLPDMPSIAYELGLNITKARRVTAELAKRGLLDGEGESLTIHGWSHRQFKSDNVNERVKRYRGVTRNDAGNDIVTPPEAEADTESETDTDTDTEKILPTVESFIASLSGQRGFEVEDGFVKKVNEKYAHLDLTEESIKIRAWIKDHPKRRCSAGFVLNWLQAALTPRSNSNGQAVLHRRAPVPAEEEALRARGF